MISSIGVFNGIAALFLFEGSLRYNLRIDTFPKS